ncbi:receptor like protein kinase S.2-like isoform X2 [Miscanthus floridulus]|uniref:receptor like protein kinase S.2-like isoform X2 n=1 Tax=Miscanthus floridulus TaxID=154761 RepID=UPI00345908A7
MMVGVMIALQSAVHGGWRVVRRGGVSPAAAVGSGRRWNKRSKMGLVGENMDIQFHMLQDITNNFRIDRVIGSGGYGIVYKGLYNGQVIAVKRFGQLQGLDDKAFDSEFRNLYKIRHPNIVGLIGYCHESQHESCGLNWPTCFKIIKGTCEGLHHLHSAQGKPIYHLNLKPANILLDKMMTAKIGDPGLSRLVSSTITHQTEMRKGTLEYMPPEYILDGAISKKFDVFSLGVIMIKIMAGNNGIYDRSTMPPKQFIELVTTNWKGKLQGTSGHSSPREIDISPVKRCIDIALRCVDENRDKRPEIKDIIDELEELEPRVDEMSMYSDLPEDLIGLQTMELNILERVVAGSEEPSHLDLSLLQSITENFSKRRKIGVGGCGEVYKGILRNGIVAVKRLFNSRTIKNKMFHREVQSLITVRHENIIRFMGYCSFTEERTFIYEGRTIMADIRERLLCFEYISNGSLENYLTDELRGLEWHTRYEIIVGICKGLLYLHKDKNIVHMDLKPANILLDDLMVPKITDFGLSRLDNNSQAATTSRLFSPVYCAPEYFLEGKSSSKSDIYSLGVLVIELVTGSKKEPDLTKVLRRWRYRWIKSSKHTPLGYQQVTKCLELAQRCIQINLTDRPDIVYVVDELNTVDSKGGQFQEIPCLEDMLGIEPLEIHFPFKLDPQISHSIELTNDTDDYVAFMTEARSRRFRIEPDKGIVPPGSKCSVTVTTQAQVNALPNNHHKEEIAVLSTRVDGGLAGMDITRDVFNEKEGNVVDEVNVMVVFDRPPLADEES